MDRFPLAAVDEPKSDRLLVPVFEMFQHIGDAVELRVPFDIRVDQSQGDVCRMGLVQHLVLRF